MRFRPQSSRYSALLCLSILILGSRAVSGQSANYAQRFVALAAVPGLSDSARLHQLFDLDWEYTNVTYPENATYVGYRGQNDRWTDLSVPAIRKRRADYASELKVIAAINRAHLNPAVSFASSFASKSE